MADLLERARAATPDREALVEVGGSGKRISYEQMLPLVTKLANGLQGLGIERSQKVAVMSVNSADYVITYYACAMLGVTFVPLNYRAKDEELTHMLNVSQCQALFVSDRYLDLVARIRPTLTHTQHFISYNGGTADYLDYTELISHASDEDIWVEIDDSDPTLLIFTSGTTALPKGVQLTYQDMTVYVTNQQPADPELHDKLLVSAPFFHIAGATAMMLAIWSGRTLVILPTFTPELWLEAVDKEKATHAFVVPTMLKRVMEDPNFEDYDISSMRSITSLN